MLRFCLGCRFALTSCSGILLRVCFVQAYRGGRPLHSALNNLLLALPSMFQVRPALCFPCGLSEFVPSLQLSSTLFASSQNLPQLDCLLVRFRCFARFVMHFTSSLAARQAIFDAVIAVLNPSAEKPAVAAAPATAETKRAEAKPAEAKAEAKPTPVAAAAAPAAVAAAAPAPAAPAPTPSVGFLRLGVVCSLERQRVQEAKDVKDSASKKPEHTGIFCDQCKMAPIVGTLACASSL